MLALDLARRRQEEEEGDRELEALLARLERGGERALAFAEAERLTVLYRGAAARLASARARSHDLARARYLEALVRRGHFALYVPPRRGLEPLWSLLLGGLARRFRATWVLAAVSFLLFSAGALTGYVATGRRADLAYPLLGVMLPADLVQGLIESGRVREAYLSAGQGSDLGHRSVFAAALAANNARVALLSFALGLLAGLPTVALQLLNGAVLGSLAALFSQGGQGLAFWAWVLPHGVPEVLALCLGGAGGLLLGLALVAPGVRPRRELLVRAGRQAAELLAFALLLLLYAALIEAFFRQAALPVGARLALAAFNLVALTAYLALAGRSAGANSAGSRQRA